MKKTIKRPDGSEEVVEGTAEEIAEYEQKLREGTKPSKKKKPVLHGAEVDGVTLTEDETMLVRLKRMGFLQQKEVNIPVFIPYQSPYIAPYRLKQTACMICGQYGCMQTHIWCSNGMTTVTGTSLLLDTGACNEFSIVEESLLPLTTTRATLTS